MWANGDVFDAGQVIETRSSRKAIPQPCPHVYPSFGNPSLYVTMDAEPILIDLSHVFDSLSSSTLQSSPKRYLCINI